MPIASYVPTKLKLAQVSGGGHAINFSGTLICMLVTAGGGLPDTTNAGIQFVSDVLIGNPEVTGTGYSRQTLTSVTVAYDGSVNTQVDFSHAAITFAQNAAGFTNARYVILYGSTGVDSTSPIFLVFDPNTTLSAQSGSVILSSPVGGELQWI
jgi:hypothetical protein